VPLNTKQTNKQMVLSVTGRQAGERVLFVGTG